MSNGLQHRAAVGRVRDFLEVLPGVAGSGVCFCFSEGTAVGRSRNPARPASHELKLSPAAVMQLVWASIGRIQQCLDCCSFFFPCIRCVVPWRIKEKKSPFFFFFFFLSAF